MFLALAPTFFRIVQRKERWNLACLTIPSASQEQEEEGGDGGGDMLPLHAA